MSMMKTQKTSIYRECKKNHAVHLGTHAVDGCGEYIPSSVNSSDPASLTCAACGCHRNFHRPPSYCDNYELIDEVGEEAAMLKSLGGGVKRCRRHFSKEQKEEMVELAESIGWSLKAREDGLVEEACKRIGVERGAFKGWVRNHKKFFLASKSNIPHAELAVITANGEGHGDGDEEEQVSNSSTPP